RELRQLSRNLRGSSDLSVFDCRADYAQRVIHAIGVRAADVAQRGARIIDEPSRCEQDGGWFAARERGFAPMPDLLLKLRCSCDGDKYHAYVWIREEQSLC